MDSLPHRLATSIYPPQLIQPTHHHSALDTLTQAVSTSVSLKLAAPPRGTWFKRSSTPSFPDWVRRLLDAWSVPDQVDSLVRIAALTGLLFGLRQTKQDSRLAREVEVELLVAVQLGFHTLGQDPGM